MKLKLYKAAAIAVLATLASCSSAPKKVPYVMEAEMIPAEVLAQISTINDPILSPGDLLNIDVTATDMISVAPFNRGMYIGADGQISRMTNNTNMTGGGNGSESSTQYYLINPDGNITFPGIGSIKAAGLTKQQLASEITDYIYPKYVKEKPIVDVRLMNFRVIVTGAVRSPGIVRTTTERMNFFEAIAQAGDLDIKGDRENILLFRTNADGKREVHKLNIHDRNFLVSPYFNLQQNDIIYVVPNASMKQNAWALNNGVTATLTYVGGLSSVLSLVVGIINLSKK